MNQKMGKTDPKGTDGMMAEAYVNGVLRGGTLKNNIFIYHKGTKKIETKRYYNLRNLE